MISRTADRCVSSAAARLRASRGAGESASRAVSTCGGQHENLASRRFGARRDRRTSASRQCCAGEAKTASDPKSWFYVPIGTCAKIQGGSLTPKA
ncbi:MAG TPA: DUF2282 domain-containing protein [Alphaproteobacteria bacterium]|nr:DUF2282 domain-containing protein [Alphaproteobacteria bacterium]